MSAKGWAESLRRFNERKKAEKQESTLIYNVLPLSVNWCFRLF